MTTSAVHWPGLNVHGIKCIVSYDGYTGDKFFGKPLPALLQLRQLQVCAGRSTQAMLLGRTDETYDALYLSPAIWADQPPETVWLRNFPALSGLSESRNHQVCPHGSVLLQSR